MNPQNLRIKCPTWDHVDNFCRRKVKQDNTLTARVPFCPQAGDAMTLSLELPSGVVVDIAASVDDVREAPDGKKSAIRLQLHGFSTELRQRLDESIARSREGGVVAEPRSKPAEVVPPRTRTGVPVPVPTDAPVDEPAELLTVPSLEQVPEAERGVFSALQSEMASFREKAAHEVLGVRWDASVPEIRSAYFGLAKKYHPDVHARHRSRAIYLLVSELFVYVNRAYDRMRDTAVAAGQAIVAGPALLPHQGWMASFDDLGTVRPRAPLRSDDLSGRAAAVAEALMSGKKRAGADGVSIRFVASGTSSPPVVAGGAKPDPQPASGSDKPRGRPDSLADELFADVEPRPTRSGMEALADPEGLVVGDLSGLKDRASSLLAERRFEEARAVLADVLEVQPRDRISRARYHYVCGEVLAANERRVEAVTQFEVALAHDPACEEARVALHASKPEWQKRASFFKRLFRR